MKCGTNGQSKSGHGKHGLKLGKRAKKTRGRTLTQ